MFALSRDKGGGTFGGGVHMTGLPVPGDFLEQLMARKPKAPSAPRWLKGELVRQRGALDQPRKPRPKSPPTPVQTIASASL